MNHSFNRNKVVRYTIEVGRWILVAWLLFPFRQRMYSPLEFVRTALGVVLFVIFTGKMFYDSVIWKEITGRSREGGRDLLSLAAIVLIITMLVAVTVFFVGLYIVNIYQSTLEPQPEM